jgi:hypothetical protein
VAGGGGGGGGGGGAAAATYSGRPADAPACRAMHPRAVITPCMGCCLMAVSCQSCLARMCIWLCAVCISVHLCIRGRVWLAILGYLIHQQPDFTFDHLLVAVCCMYLQ